MSLENQVKSMLNEHAQVQLNPSRKALIQATVENREVIVATNGAVATWTPPESTGRSPKDTVIVKRAVSEGNIDWDSPNNISIDEETFDMLFADALATLSRKECLYVTDRVIGADATYTLPTRTISDFSLAVLFTDNMFREVPEDMEQSIFAGRGFTLL
ncbi:MAG: phosphoenolpyruvate carboxykinase (ATP), partial [Deltaproteobacteria bacterium]|nr:phosphoenolpyruvate carboxykinase (ATP) [Deltaproteobacteria bacterium]